MEINIGLNYGTVELQCQDYQRAMPLPLWATSNPEALGIKGSSALPEQTTTHFLYIAMDGFWNLQITHSFPNSQYRKKLPFPTQY